MRRLWLLFAQTITVCLAIWFIVVTLKPEWLELERGELAGVAFTVSFETELGPDARRQYAGRGHRAGSALPVRPAGGVRRADGGRYINRENDRSAVHLYTEPGRNWKPWPKITCFPRLKADRLEMRKIKAALRQERCFFLSAFGFHGHLAAE